ncbi:MAG: FAD-dependent oxidoreductase [Proteobacteria bacterium]|nr:FAD-dependent oxidoreductase [Pseudomonadota bacterium]
MNLPEINTWTNGETFAEVANQVMGKQFPGQEPKALMGWKGIMIWDRNVDAVAMLKAYLDRVAAESCGQCTPCREGTHQLTRIMGAMCRCEGSEEDIETIRSLVTIISLTSRCNIGLGLAKPVLDLLDCFNDDFIEVIHRQRFVEPGRYNSMVTAPCINACPSHVDIPAYLEHVRMGHWPEAMAVVRQGCPMPGTIGRVCVRPCEENCRRKDLDSPLAIRAIKRFLSDQEQFHGMRSEEPMPHPQAEKIAIVGGGPAGLSCSYYLGRLGYPSTVFEAQEGPGGMAAYGIPSYRLPKDVIAHEVGIIEHLGAEIRYGVHVGRDITVDDLSDQGYRAVFLAMGAPESSPMRCEGEDKGYMGFMPGVHFLAQAARGQKPLDGRRAVVIGGGNVAMDCVRSLLRLGFKDVNLLYRRTEAEMPADHHEIEEAKEEGVVFHFLVAPVEILAKDGRVTGLMCRRMELGEPDASGRRRPVPVPDSDYVMDCDAIIPAVGQKCVVDRIVSDEDVLTAWKTLVVDETTFQTGKKLIFGGGDCVTGPATLIASLAAGKNAARFIDQYLQTGQCTPQPKDVLETLVTSGQMFEDDEPFLFPGISTRMEPEIIDPDTRIQDFGEVEKGFSPVQARMEASRCLRCYRMLMTAV